MPMQWRDRGRMDGSKPLVSLDIHAEAPGDSRRRRMTVLDREREHSKVVFNKQIAGRYRSGHAAYEEVGVLLIVWEADDMSCERAEVRELRDVFENDFHFSTEIFQIPSDRSATALGRKLADFAWNYDSPNKMAIVYYGGHGDNSDASNEGRLQLFAKAQSGWNGNPEDFDPAAFFDDAVHTLKLPDTDILVIVDCCYAALAFSREEIGKRKFELLSSVPPHVRAVRPEQNGSFTKTMIEQLKLLLEKHPEGFMTSQLYRQVYFQQKDPRKPFLFDQSPFDYGKLWLKPLKTTKTSASQPAPEGNATPRESSIQIDLKLHMSSMPNESMLSELARSMQYLPHVKRLDFVHLHAPEAELHEYIRGLAKTTALRPLIWKLRQRLQAKRLRRQGVKPHIDAECLSESPFHLKRRDTSLYDWSASELVSSTQSHTRADTTIGDTQGPPLQETKDDMQTSAHDAALESAKPHYLGSWISIVYSLDASGLQDRLTSGREKTRRYWSATTVQQRMSFCGLWLLVLLSYLATKSIVWEMLFE